MLIKPSTEAFQWKHFWALGSSRYYGNFVLQLSGYSWERFEKQQGAYCCQERIASQAHVFQKALSAVLDQRVHWAFVPVLTGEEDQECFQQVLGRALQKCWLRIQLPEVEAANRGGSFCRRETGTLLRAWAQWWRWHATSSSCWSSHPCNISIVAQMEGTMEEFPMDGKALQAAELPGTSHWDGGQGVRWAPCLQEMYTDGWSVLPTKGAAGGDRLHSIRDCKKEVHWNFSKTVQIKEPENPTGRCKGRICAYLDGKIRIPWWPRLKACDFWHQKDVSCSPWKSATTEEDNKGGKW